MKIHSDSDAVETRLSRTIASTQTLQLAENPAFDLFYTPIDQRFERITRLIRRSTGTRVAAITWLGKKNQWFKSVAGWNVTQLNIKQSLCAALVHDRGIVVVEDTLKESRLKNHPLVSSGPRFRFYAAYPLTDPTGTVSGTLCVMDTHPRSFSESDRQALEDCGELAQQELLAQALADNRSKLIAKLGNARRQAMFDTLTRVWNRRGALGLLNSTLKQAADTGGEVSVCLIDLDDFKRVNDTFGHGAGDQVLRKIAARMVEAVRTDDLVCRLGGDEFLLILPDTCEEQTRLVAERVRRAVSDEPFATRDGLIRMTISIGCAFSQRGETPSGEALVERADDALLASKRGGRNRVRLTG